MTTEPKQLNVTLDRGSSVPVYRQLADELKYRVATGDISIGSKLPPLAEGAKVWGVNLHTVQRAYADLKDDGIAEMIRGRGTFVTAKPINAPVGGGVGGGRGAAGVASFLDWISSHAQRTFGLDRETLAQLLVAPAPHAKVENRLGFVECSTTQSDHHANEIADMWEVKTMGWSLEREGEPPPGPFVATYFHYNDIRRRWPHRMADANFVSIHPSRELRRNLEVFHAGPDQIQVRLYERSLTMARSIAADVIAALPEERFRVSSEVIGDTPQNIAILAEGLYLFPPRLWWELSESQKACPNVFEIEYEIAEPDMARLAQHFAWDLRLSS